MTLLGKHIGRAKSIGLLKILTIGATVILAILAIWILHTSQRTHDSQQRQAQQAVLNHTETLDEINNAVLSLKKNNQANHDTTVKYIQCIVNLFIIESHGGTVTQGAFDACLNDSGLAPTTATPATSTSSNLPTTTQPQTQTNATPTQNSVSQSTPTQTSAGASGATPVGTPPASQKGVVGRILDDITGLF